MKILITLILLATFNLFNLNLASAEDKKNEQSHADHKKGKGHDHQNHDHKGHKHGDGHVHKEGHKMQAAIKSQTQSEVTVKVEGMVCAFCAQGIVKNFEKRPEVKKTEVDLDKMEVMIKFKKEKSLDQKTIAEIVKGAGFQFKGVKGGK